MARIAWVVALLLWPLAAPAQEFTTFKGHGGPIMALALAADGTVMSASFDNSVGLWVPDGPIWLEGHEAAVNALLAGPDGRVISAGDDFSVRSWAGAKGRVLYRHKGKVVGLALSHQIASASWDGTIGLYSMQDGRPHFLHGHRSAVNAVAFDTTGQRLFSAGADGTIRIWDVARREEKQQLVRHGFGINEIVLNDSDGWLAYGAVDGGTRIVDPESGAEIADFTLDRRPILAMAYHPQTAQLAVGDGQGFIMMINTDDWEISRDFKAMRDGPVWALAFSPDGRMVYAGGLDDVVYGWPVDLLDRFEPGGSGARSFLRDAGSMPNGERQFMRKCSICHALAEKTSRKAGPSLFGIFGRRAGTFPGYSYSPTLMGSDIVWDEDTIDALFDQGPDHFIPGSKMPMQVISGAMDRSDLIAFLRNATGGDRRSGLGER
ncbi:MAG: c-type cytochrome [Marinibacterium sp.]